VYKCNLGARKWEVGSIKPRPRYPPEKFVAYHIGGCVGFRSPPEDHGTSRPHRDSIPGQSIP